MGDLKSLQEAIENADASVETARIAREDGGDSRTHFKKCGSVGSLRKEANAIELDIKKRTEVHIWERPAEWGRRLAGCSVLSDHDAPSDWFLFAPILLILMLVFFIHRRRVHHYFSNAVEKPSYEGLRYIRKKAPQMTLSY